MTTVLRLPHMDIVLASGEDLKPPAQLRRSDRIRNLSGTSSQEQGGRKRERRRRYNSVMEEDDGEDPGPRRREPEHRRINRLRLMKENDKVS